MMWLSILLALSRFIWLSSVSSAAPSAAPAFQPAAFLSTPTAFGKSRDDRKRRAINVAPSADYETVLSKYGLSAQHSPSKSCLPGSTQHKIRQCLLYSASKSIELGLIAIISRFTKNRFRLGVNIVRWVVLSMLFLFVKWHAQLSVTTNGIEALKSIDQERYLISDYDDDPENAKCEVATISTFPGNGSCLFYALAASLLHTDAKKNYDRGVDIPLSWSDIRQKGAELRRLAVDTLEDKNLTLIINDQEAVSSSELVNAASSSYRMTAEQYCRSMRRASCWGGGPEIVGLSNALQRSIHLYQACDASSLANNNNNMQYTGEYTLNRNVALHRIFHFGSSRFTRKSLNILLSGDHFEAVFPELS